MFTIEQIEQAHESIKTGADFPTYIQQLKELGVIIFETWVKDSHTEYFGVDNFTIKSNAQFVELSISDNCKRDDFKTYLESHQKGQTDYFQFCKDCAETGIEKWIVNLEDMSCTYFDKKGNKIIKEKIPG